MLAMTAQEMARKRWDAVPIAARSEPARKAARARWAKKRAKKSRRRSR